MQIDPDTCRDPNLLAAEVRRLRALQNSEMPTVDDYREALIQCVADKASDWKAACESAEAASKEIGKLKSEIARLRLTHEERRDIAIAADAYADNDDDPDCERIAATLRKLLERTA